MGTIGLAHRTHRDFVVDWLEPDEPSNQPDEGLTERIEAVRGAARPGSLDELDQTREQAPPAGDPHAPETWLAGEPTF